MATVTDKNDKPEIDDDDADDRDDTSKSLEYRAAEGKASTAFFSIYKPGQGYWTRMGTIAGAVLIILGCANFIFFELPARVEYLRDHKSFLLGLVAGLAAGMALLTFYLINKPTNAQFLIDTDQEMKKVNWTGRRELWGSTKVVIFFMFLIATFLFLIDVGAGYFFYFIHVLKNKPF